MSEIKSLCVYCGSSVGADPAYREAAVEMGTLLAREGITLVFGGGKVGLMGTVADAALAAGGKVHGVIPHALSGKEVLHPGLTEVEIVGSMHERKARMAELSDGFVAMPGGLGTFEELFETWTWGQLGWHAKPVALLDVAGFYAPLAGFLDHVVAQGFVQDVHRRMLLVDRRPADLLARLRAYVPPETPKWLGPDEI
jgi:uncharacterized protein (TIGR00730 family)